MKAVKENTSEGDVRDAEKFFKTYFRPFTENFKPPPHAQSEEGTCKYYCISLKWSKVTVY
jgi:hypothetical protein